MSDPFLAYSKKALSPVPAKLIGVTKTRAEAKADYSRIVTDLRRCRTLEALRECLDKNHLVILQMQAELEFLWFGDGHDFTGLEREIEIAFETVEASQFFNKFQPAAQVESEAGRLPGQQ